MEQIKFLGRCASAVAGLLTLLLITGCHPRNYNVDPLGVGQVGSKDPVWADAQKSPDASGAALQVGDEVDVTFVNVPSPYNQPNPAIISEDGTITLIHDQKFKAEGKTVNQLIADIKERYVPKFYTTVDVTVLTPKRTFTVGGEVKTPGTVQYPGRMDLVQAINMAGGLTDFASRGSIELTRSKGEKPIKVDYDKALKKSKDDPEIYPGDRINVPRRWF